MRTFVSFHDNESKSRTEGTGSTKKKKTLSPLEDANPGSLDFMICWSTNELQGVFRNSKIAIKNHHPSLSLYTISLHVKERDGKVCERAKRRKELS